MSNVVFLLSDIILDDGDDDDDLFVVVVDMVEKVCDSRVEFGTSFTAIFFRKLFRKFVVVVVCVCM